jgi:hypothetical protein
MVQVHLTLCVDEAVSVPVLATQRPLNDDYGHRLWLLTDLHEREHQSDWRYLEETVNEVAQNARLPLMLASSLVRNARRVLKQPAVANMLESAVRQINKADITYERLATTLALRQEPDRPRQIFDAVDVLRQAVADLPEEDIRHCDLTDLLSAKDPKPFLIAGWPEQLSFAFRSLLGYSLLRCPTEAKVRIALSNAADATLQILISVPTGVLSEMVVSASSADRIGVAEQRARQAASLAPDAVALAVNRHEGEFRVDTEDSSTLAFRIALQPSRARSRKES